MTDVVARELQPFKDSIEQAFIFGSVARGFERPDSDVDLMVVGDIDVFELGPTLEKLQKVLGRAVDLNLHTPSEWQALAGDQVIGAIMKEERIMVVGHRS
ncbi:nucleotidyltransferase domain-containing protein [Rhizobium sullae]|uniref:nucleotidyltransferase domain-containing protein n=1 Tax=Rhizobium sullae TaxID=50338 RepID=UPI001FCD7C5C|nr:nucleotidyltransferase domain-containing protein [Rhizobium sullae]